MVVCIDCDFLEANGIGCYGTIIGEGERGKEGGKEVRRGKREERERIERNWRRISVYFIIKIVRITLHKTLLNKVSKILF